MTNEEIVEFIHKAMERGLDDFPWEQPVKRVEGHEGHKIYQLPFDKELVNDHAYCDTCQAQLIATKKPLEYIMLKLEVK
jgi:hypothetical protein